MMSLVCIHTGVFCINANTCTCMQFTCTYTHMHIHTHTHTHTHIHTCTHTQHTHTHTHTTQTQHAPGDSDISLEGLAQVQAITLRREDKKGFGFTIEKCEQGSSPSVIVGSITPRGPADMDGQLQVGDQILSVDNQKILGYAFEKVTRDKNYDFLRNLICCCFFHFIFFPFETAG